MAAERAIIQAPESQQYAECLEDLIGVLEFPDHCAFKHSYSNLDGHPRKGGRPKTYLSKEERLAAHRISNRASWQKRADQQNLMRREKYREQRPTLEQFILRNAPGTYNPLAAVAMPKRIDPNPILKESERNDIARVGLVRARQIDQEFSAYVGSDPRLFVEARLLEYLSQVSSHNEDRDAMNVIDGPAETIAQLRQKCYDIRDHIWQRVGSGKHYDRITDIMDGMRGWKSLREMYSQRKLQYQK
ncbi:hypothetical protein BDZ89DRAFT_1049346 [Hymenopellis radicata]|nr:hypothetical protein BDZ89DRAFT_1049346 [Hymenopellis radicata]